MFAPGTRFKVIEALVLRIEPAELVIRTVKLAKEADFTMDDTQRRAVMKRLLDRNAREAFILPVASTFTYTLHTDEIAVRPGGRYEIYGFYLSDLSWK